jgi:beta-lactam-binding protein with PASTA domain
MPSRSASKPVRQRVWSIGRFLILVSALIGTFGIFFLAGMRVTTRAREVTVPDLKGKSAAESRALLEDMGLTLRIDDIRKPDKSVPPDRVLDQDPAAGLVVRRQRAVKVRLSEGQVEPVVPSVTDMAERTADLTLTSDQIAVGYRAEIRSARYRPGVVVAQDPIGGRRSATVNLVVNHDDSTAGFVAPDLIGTMAIRSADVLRKQGFRVAITSESNYPGLPPGVVIRQTPQPGYRIQASDPITLEVSK